MSVVSHRGPRPLEAEACGDDPLVGGEGEEEEPGRGLVAGKPESHAWHRSGILRDKLNISNLQTNRELTEPGPRETLELQPEEKLGE